VTAWAAGWNLSGYLPAVDPPRFDSWHEARDEMRDLLCTAIEHDRSAPQDTFDALQDLSGADPDKPWSWCGEEFTYWIEPADEPYPIEDVQLPEAI
jgi:hypothetical protein